MHLNMYSLSTLSNAFSWSKLRIYVGIFFLLEYSITSLIVNRLLYIVLFGTAADCSIEMISSKVGSNLFVSALVIIL